jgi:hypothetical protein
VQSEGKRSFYKLRRPSSFSVITPMAPVVKAKSWSLLDTERLIELENEGVIDVNDPLHLSKDYIEKIRFDHFRHFLYKNFKRNYKDKLRDYCFAGEYLDGARRKGKEYYWYLIITPSIICTDVHFFVVGVQRGRQQRSTQRRRRGK